MDVVVVESPAKAKTINKYLGENFIVLASYGHVRDLPSKEGSVQPDDNFAMTYAVEARAKKHIDAIASAVRGAKHLYLATDPDREGEAISWHVLDVLRKQKVLEGVEVKRVVFNEITQRAVLEGIAHPRDIDMSLVNAQQARRALDYLVGFSLSPVLWRKLPGSRSAGRVQSVALRLICERELEIEAFEPREYWSVEVEFRKEGEATPFRARLTTLEGRKLDKFDLANEAAAQAAVATIERAAGYSVANLERKEAGRHPPPPFTTSTLQQEAARKIRLRPQRTMQVAQRLYEGVDIGGETVGLITYMRTDGVQIANEALVACRAEIARSFGDKYVPERPRVYKTAAKNAQEAHEAIRPTDLSRTPEQVASALAPDELKLYELIWKRTIASQMASALIERATVDIMPTDRSCTLRATGSITLFDGFLKLYQEGRDEDADKEEDRALPRLNTGDAVTRSAVLPEQHFTEPPPRYSEASLVKKMEELGIGRPSTYASILEVLQDRKYVRLDRARFVPEDRGQLVTAFLVGFFQRYVEYSFTADLETQLDDISAGNIDWLEVLRQFWSHFKPAVDSMSDLKVRDVLDALNEILGPHIFPAVEEGHDPRKCPACADGRLSLKIGRFGSFVGCSNYPECRFTRGLSPSPADSIAVDGPVQLGTDPVSTLAVTLRKGPYGLYIQLGEAENDTKPKRVTLPRNIPADGVTPEIALGLLSLPRDVGPHPETGKMITAGIGRFGPFIRHDGVYVSLPADEDVLVIGLNRAVDLIAQKPARGRRGAPDPLRVLGPHPQGGGEIKLMQGRYGPYVTHGRVNATLPKDADPQKLTVEEAVALLAARAGKSGKTAKGRGKAAKASGGDGATATKKAARKPKGKTVKRASTTKAGAKTGAKSGAKSVTKAAGAKKPRATPRKRPAPATDTDAAA